MLQYISHSFKMISIKKMHIRRLHNMLVLPTWAMERRVNDISFQGLTNSNPQYPLYVSSSSLYYFMVVATAFDGSDYIDMVNDKFSELGNYVFKLLGTSRKALQFVEFSL